MIELLAAIALQSTSANKTTETICVALNPSPRTELYFFTNKTKLSEIGYKLKGVRACSADRTWESHKTTALCDGFARLADSDKATIERNFGIHPDTICDAARQATP